MCRRWDGGERAFKVQPECMSLEYDMFFPGKYITMCAAAQNGSPHRMSYGNSSSTTNSARTCTGPITISNTISPQLLNSSPLTLLSVDLVGWVAFFRRAANFPDTMFAVAPVSTITSTSPPSIVAGSVMRCDGEYAAHMDFWPT